MAMDDARVQSGGRGGPRTRSWEQDGKRAVVAVDGHLYQLVTLLSKLSRQPARHVCTVVFLRGLESLFGQPTDVLQQSYRVLPGCGVGRKDPRPTTALELEALAAKAFEFESSEGE